MQAVLALLLVLAVACAHAADEAVVPTANLTLGDDPPIPPDYNWPPLGCPFSYINCANGNNFDFWSCNRYVYDLGPPSFNTPQHFAAYQTCTCPPGTAGVACNILTSPPPFNQVIWNGTLVNQTEVCNPTGPFSEGSSVLNGSTDGSIFAGNFYEPYRRARFECEADLDTPHLMLKDHRITYETDVPNKAASFTVWSRWWTNSRWSPVMPVVSCDSHDCVYETPDQTSDADGYDFVLNCATANCSGCQWNSNCQDFYYYGFAQTLHWFKIGVITEWAINSTARIDLITNQPTIHQTCIRGECVNPVDIPVVPSAYNYNWMIITSICVAIAFFGWVAIRAIWKNRRAKQSLLARRAARKQQKILQAAATRASNVQHPALDKSGGYVPVPGFAVDDDVKSISVAEATQPTVRLDLCVIFSKLEYSIALRSANICSSAPDGDGAAGGKCCGAAKRRTILNDIHGFVRSGEIVALMGESGAGKSTLLDILSNTPKIGTIVGHHALYYNGNRVQPDEGQFPDFVCYLASEDTLMASQTVFESVLFSARLRLTCPKQYEDDPDEYFTDQCEKVLSDVGLWHIRDSRVGSVEFGGISSGERKRLALAIELVTEPLVLLADEPTSGLDSYSANLVMRVLHTQCRTRGMCVITAIHQPPINTWPLFDRLLVLTRKGELAYSGPANRAVPFMTAATGVKLPDDSNPAEFLLDTASLRFRKVADAYRRSDVFEQLLTEIKQLGMTPALSADAPQPACVGCLTPRLCTCTT